LALRRRVTVILAQFGSPLERAQALVDLLAEDVTSIELRGALLGLIQLGEVERARLDQAIEQLPRLQSGWVARPGESAASLEAPDRSTEPTASLEALDRSVRALRSSLGKKGHASAPGQDPDSIRRARETLLRSVEDAERQCKQLEDDRRAIEAVRERIAR
jgi:hypothetical protein